MDEHSTAPVAPISQPESPPHDFTNALFPEGIKDNPEGALSVLIVGAGIGGLSAAIALRNVGHRVFVLDKSGLDNDTGAAIHLCPNANGILRKWGVMAENFGACVVSRFVERASDGRTLKDMDLTESNTRWPHPWHLVRRAGLHRELRRIATAEDGPGIPVRVVPRIRVDQVIPSEGLVTLETGQELKTHVVIGADGIYSTMRKYVAGASGLYRTGKAAFRFILPRAVAKQNPLTADLASQHDTFTVWFARDRRVVMYPCDGNELLNFVCIHPDTESSKPAADGWSRDATLENVLKVFQDFEPQLKALISMADPSSIKVWPLLDIPPLGRWSLGKLVLIGDAAHPCLPYQAQGAAQAIEDAATLAAVLPRGTPPDAVPERLRLFRTFRCVRTGKIQDVSRLMGRDWVDEGEGLDLRTYEVYNFGHDEIAHSTALFNKWLEDRKFGASYSACYDVPQPR